MRTATPRNFFAELKRRNVIRAAILYLGAVWALAQGISQLGPSVGAPEWATRWFLVAAAIGFPFSIAFAWFYEFTPEGLKRESEKKDSVSGQALMAYFAVIAAWAGEKDLALQQLATAVPTYGTGIATSYGMLKLFPFWDPLRGDPRFERIVASLAPKESAAAAK